MNLSAPMCQVLIIAFASYVISAGLRWYTNYYIEGFSKYAKLSANVEKSSLFKAHHPF